MSGANDDLKAKMREALDKKNKKEKGVHEDGPVREKAHGSEVRRRRPEGAPAQGRWRRLLTGREIGHASTRCRRLGPAGGWAHAVRTQLRGVRGRCDLQALARQDGHRVRRPPVLPAHDEPPPAAPRRALRGGDDAVRQERRRGQLRLLDPARHVASPTSPARRSPTSRSSRCATSRRRSTATRCTARPRSSTSGSRSPRTTAASSTSRPSATTRTARSSASSAAR